MSKKYEGIYRCIGENPSNHSGIGYCGEAHNLEDWIEILFQDKEQALEFFKDDNLNDILDYIHMNRGKRLKKV